MRPPRPQTHDALRPSEADALDAWASRCRADREQVERCREVEDPSDFYAPVAQRFAQDPRRTEDSSLDALLSLVRPDETWLDIGSGGGRYALPLALHAGHVHAVDPSPSMHETLAAGMRAHGIENVTTMLGRWPLADDPQPRADAILMAHVGYDIEQIGPFLDAAEAAAGRLCVAMMGESAMTTAASIFWASIHGEERVLLPALPELLVLLVARGRLPQLTLVPRRPPVFESLEELADMARRQLWLRPGSDKDRRLRRLVEERATSGTGGWTLDPAPSRVGIVAWEPRT